MVAPDQEVPHPKKMTAGAPNLSKMTTGENLPAPARGEMKTIGRDQPAHLPTRVAGGEKSLVETRTILAVVKETRGETMSDRARTAFLQKTMTTNGVDLVHRAQEEENHGVALSVKVTGKIEALTPGVIKKKVERMDGALLRTTANVLVLLKLRPLAGETPLTPATRDLADGVQPPNRKTPDGETQVL